MKFFGLMVFVISVGPCATYLPSISGELWAAIKLLDYDHDPLIDFALSMLITAWCYHPTLRPICVSHRSTLLTVCHNPSYLAN
jgi:hypothetical protein